MVCRSPTAMFEFLLASVMVVALGAPPALVINTAMFSDKLVMSSPLLRRAFSDEDAAPSILMDSSASLGAEAVWLPVGESAEAVLCGDMASNGTGPRGDSVEMEEAPPGDIAAMAESGDNGAEVGVLER